MSKCRYIVNYLNHHDLVLATAESCTAGQLMSLLAKEGKCGNCLFIGYVVYNATAKIKQLGVKPSTIEKHTLTSEEVAKEMVKGVFQHEEINAAIATTGITGTKPMDGISPGTVCIAWAFKVDGIVVVYSETKYFNVQSRHIPRRAAYYAISRLVHYHQKSQK